MKVYVHRRDVVFALIIGQRMPSASEEQRDSVQERLFEPRHNNLDWLYRSEVSSRESVKGTLIRFQSLARAGCMDAAHANLHAWEEQSVLAGQVRESIKEQNGRGLARVNPFATQRSHMTGYVYFQMRIISCEIISTLQGISCVSCVI